MTKKISPSLIKEAIVAEAKVLKRKHEIYNELKALNEEIKTLDEAGMVGTFGFDIEGDVSKRTKTGFVNDEGVRPMSYVQALMDGFEEEETKDQNLKEENEALKQELEDLKSQIKEQE